MILRHQNMYFALVKKFIFRFVRLHDMRLLDKLNSILKIYVGLLKILILPNTIYVVLAQVMAKSWLGCQHLEIRDVSLVVFKLPCMSAWSTDDRLDLAMYLLRCIAFVWEILVWMHMTISSDQQMVDEPQC